MTTPAWQHTSHLPEHEPDETNHTQYAHPQLIAGASADGQFIYDAVYVFSEQTFVLTLMQIDEVWGFVAQEARLNCTTRTALLHAIENFQAAPLAYLQHIQAA